MESNHRFLDVDQASSPLDHGTEAAAAAGVEPAILSLTGSSLTVGPTPQKSQDGGSRTHTAPVPEAGGIPLSDVLKRQRSTQRESNPHGLHGKQAGCPYIMGAHEKGRASRGRHPALQTAREAGITPWRWPRRNLDAPARWGGRRRYSRRCACGPTWPGFLSIGCVRATFLGCRSPPPGSRLFSFLGCKASVETAGGAH
jgi:hypothetical protein